MTSPSPLGLRRAVRNAATGYGVRAIVGVSVLALTPYLYRQLGAGGFGTWSVMWGIAAIFTVVEFGGLAGISKHVAHARGAGRRADLERSIGQGVTMMAIAGLLIGAICLATALLADGLAASGQQDDFRLGLTILAAVALVRLPLMAYDAVLVGYQRYDLHNASWCISVLVFSVGAVSAVELGGGVVGVALAYGVGLIAGGASAAAMLAHVDQRLPWLPRRIGRGDGGALVSLSSYSTLADSMLLAGQRMDTTVIAAVRGAAAAAPFAAAVKVQSAVQSLVLPFAELLLPMLSELWGRGERSEVARRLIAGTRLALLVVLPVTVAVGLLASDLTDLWLGRDATDVTAQVVTLLVAAQVLWLASIPADRALIATGRVRALGALAVCEGIGNLGLTIVLVHAHGAVGAAISTLVVCTLLTPLRIPLACRAVGTSIRSVLARGLARPIVSTAPAIAAMVGVRMVMQPGLARVAAVMVAGAVIQASVVIAQVGRRRAIELVKAVWRGVLLSRRLTEARRP